VLGNIHERLLLLSLLFICCYNSTVLRFVVPGFLQEIQGLLARHPFRLEFRDFVLEKLEICLARLEAHGTSESVKPPSDVFLDRWQVEILSPIVTHLVHPADERTETVRQRLDPAFSLSPRDQPTGESGLQIL